MNMTGPFGIRERTCVENERSVALQVPPTGVDQVLSAFLSEVKGDVQMGLQKQKPRDKTVVVSKTPPSAQRP